MLVLPVLMLKGGSGHGVPLYTLSGTTSLSFTCLSPFSTSKKPGPGGASGEVCLSFWSQFLWSYWLQGMSRRSGSDDQGCSLEHLDHELSGSFPGSLTALWLCCVSRLFRPPWRSINRRARPSGPSAVPVARMRSPACLQTSL